MEDVVGISGCPEYPECPYYEKKQKEQAQRQKILIIADIIAVTGSMLFLTSGIISLILDTAYIP